MTSLAGKKVLVVGLGKSGMAAVRFFVSEGAQVTVNDRQDEERLSSVWKTLSSDGVQCAFGHHDLSLLQGKDLIVVSPGIPLSLPLLKEARHRGMPLVGEMELALQRLQGKTPIIAVTGTNGKTTTTSLIGHLLRARGLRACVAGNIGIPLLDVVPEALESDWLVVEVSSYQLETTPSLCPRIAILLNITPDHLDRYPDFSSYRMVKGRIFQNLEKEGYALYNAADPEVLKTIGHLPPQQAIPFHAWKALHLGGSYDAETHTLWTREGLPLNWDLSRVSLAGGHNRENILAALLACQCAGTLHTSLQGVLETFRGLPHRMEYVGKVRDIPFYDDSKGTNIGATKQALMGCDRPVVLIAGGQHKGMNYTSLIPLMKEKVRTLVVIGEAADLLERDVGGSVETVRGSSMQDAVQKAFEAAHPGDMVLLSPACASFDMFQNYAARGEAFVTAVKHLGTFVT